MRKIEKQMCQAVQQSKNWSSSNTTKSRLNALCDEFCIAGEGVFQKNFKWYVSRFVGQAGQSKVYNQDDFVNGYTFS